MHKSNKNIIAVGMSGGVDSTVAVFLLKKQGFTVIGLTMKIWDGSVKCSSTKSGCYGPNEADDIANAVAIAAKLGIEHYTVDLCGEYNETIIEYFRDEYANGRTPNPCIVCNTKIKFGALIEKAASSGIEFDYFATGHYARIQYDTDISKYLLKRGIDATKDQSYFLYRLSQKQLEKTLFPLGDYLKSEIKDIALESGFEDLLKKPESQDFFECDDYGELLNYRGKPGNIKDIEGNIIGVHKGIAFYTIGQRKTLNLSGMKEPFYVLRIDAGQNEIIAGPKCHLLNNTLIAGDLKWIIPFNPLENKTLSAQIRYRNKPAECVVSIADNGSLIVRFSGPQEAITPGQSVVLYDGDTVIGGGIIIAPAKHHLTYLKA